MDLGARPWIVGHRGAAARVLENTLASFARAVADGAAAVELDVRRTRDGRLVVAHDETLARVGGRALVIERETLATLREAPLRDGQPLPTLEEVFAALPAGFAVNVEVKPSIHPHAALVAALDGAIDRPRTLISSFDWDLLAAIRRRAPRVALAPVASAGADFDAVLAAADRVGAWSLHLSHHLAARALTVPEPRRRPVLCYTVNDPSEARYLFDSGIDGVFTDDPGGLRSALVSPRGSIRMPRSSP